jgi:hypothetical protein
MAVCFIGDHSGKHENNRDMKEWIGGKFDPGRFCVDKVNKELG